MDLNTIKWYSRARSRTLAILVYPRAERERVIRVRKSNGMLLSLSFGVGYLTLLKALRYFPAKEMIGFIAAICPLGWVLKVEALRRHTGGWLVREFLWQMDRDIFAVPRSSFLNKSITKGCHNYDVQPRVRMLADSAREFVHDKYCVGVKKIMWDIYLFWRCSWITLGPPRFDSLGSRNYEQ